jgi:hypothetical protein
LVVGGSRGLGELTVKILVAGGANVILTYANGAADARRVQQECESIGAQVGVRRLDVLEDSGSVDLGDRNTLYYFATPPIHPSGAGINPQLLQIYMNFYVVVPFRLMTSLSPSLTHCFYPSTIFLDTHHREYREYCIAKAAGEEMVRHFASNSGTFAIAPRLPRIFTDQTQTLTPRHSADAAPILLDFIRKLANLSG